MSPAEVGALPAIWWLRWSRYEHANALRAARERVERYGLKDADAYTRRLYNELIING